MTGQQPAVEDLARAFARTASAAFQDQAAYFRSLPDDAWHDPTGCAAWTMHDLAGHIVGEAIWFPHLVRTVTAGAPPLPNELWGEIKHLPGREMAGRMSVAAQELVPAVDGATPAQLQQPVDLGFTVPLWQALWICMFEAVLHHWDGRAGREPGATIPTAWAQRLAGSSVEFAPSFARREAARDAAGRYLLDVGDGVGPITVTAMDGAVTVERAQGGNADVTMHVTADQYMRLLAGRLPLRSALDKGEVTVDGDRARAENLNRLFAGIGG
jgi:uncharacterized protein (TIGR03083 family)